MADITDTEQAIIDSMDASISDKEQVWGHLLMLAEVCNKKDWKELEKAIRVALVCSRHNIVDMMITNKLCDKIKELSE